jgi:hypothetical protein
MGVGFSRSHTSGQAAHLVLQLTALFTHLLRTRIGLCSWCRVIALWLLCSPFANSAKSRQLESSISHLRVVVQKVISQVCVRVRVRVRLRVRVSV